MKALLVCLSWQVLQAMRKANNANGSGQYQNSEVVFLILHLPKDTMINHCRRLEMNGFRCLLPLVNQFVMQ